MHLLHWCCACVCAQGAGTLEGSPGGLCAQLIAARLAAAMHTYYTVYGHQGVGKLCWQLGTNSVSLEGHFSEISQACLCTPAT